MLTICTMYIALVAGAGFLFGQLFAGHFSIAATLVGVAGLACAFGGFLLSSRPNVPMPWIPWTALLTLIGIAFDIANYYMYLNISGNYYPWFGVAPYVFCVTWVAHTAYKRRK